MARGCRGKDAADGRKKMQKNEYQALLDDDVIANKINRLEEENAALIAANLQLKKALLSLLEKISFLKNSTYKKAPVRERYRRFFGSYPQKGNRERDEPATTSGPVESQPKDFLFFFCLLASFFFLFQSRNPWKARRASAEESS